MKKSIFSKVIMLSILLNDGSEVFIVKGRRLSRDVENTFKTFIGDTVDNIEIKVLKEEPRLTEVTIESFNHGSAVTSTTKIMPTASLTWTQTEDEEIIEALKDSVQEEELKEEKRKEEELEEERNRMIPTKI